jgi:TRAP-type uncharacterized transport system substrate-binding protein
MRGCALRCVWSVICLLLAGFAASFGVRAEEKPAQAWLGLIAGPPAASETVLAADMASLFATSGNLRVRPMLGDTGAGNLALLLGDPGVDLAFVSTDAIAAQVAEDNSVSGKLELVARLAPQEFHLLARSDIGNLAELVGKKVNFGPEGSASAVAAAAVFKTFGVEVIAVHLDTTAGIEQLKQGALSAAVIVGCRPSPLVAAIPINAGINLLPISFSAPLDEAYLPARLDSADYPNLIRSGSEVPTVATGIVLLAASGKKDAGARQRLDRFVASAFPRFAELQADGRHPKWREVNLAASLPGFKRAPAVEAWLAETAEQKTSPMTASAAINQMPGVPEVMSKEQQEVLFERFIEWQRGKPR